ncbi:MAG TPA: DNA/RNA non-specific endonuclease [Ferruginibacter sp.]|nr:DNA/RNA non-specific endonuclease [Ferruginibacter sp.]
MKLFNGFTILIISISLYSCKKNTDELKNTYLPTISTSAVINISSNTATAGGNISNDGGSAVTSRGIIWSTGTSAVNTTLAGTGTGSFTSDLTGLAPNTIYYVKAYATNASGTSYGNTISFSTELSAPSIPGENDPIFLGNPTNAIASSSFPENYLKDNIYYKMAYNRNRGTSVWIAWHLQSEDIGSTSRQDDYRADPNLPIGWYQVQNSSYNNSGFDRGHNCPSGDRTSSRDANSSTFLMTNMIPQASKMNSGPWAGLEDFVRNSLVGTTKEAYIVMGNYGQGGYNSSNTLVNTIDGGNVTVPSNIWKVVLILPKGTDDLSRINSSTVVLTVNMPNDNRLYTSSGTNAWRNYLTTITNLENDANSNGVPLNLFQSVADSVRPALKAKLYQ